MVRNLLSCTAATLLAILVLSGGLVPGGSGDPPERPEYSENEHERYTPRHSREELLLKAERASERMLR